MSGDLQWFGPAALEHVKGKTNIAIRRAALAVNRRAKELLSVAGTGRVKGKKAGPVTHSAPGEPPKKQTGRLRASVTYEMDEATMKARIGTNVKYGKHLELGTKRGIA